MEDCEICRRVKEKDRVAFYEDDNVIACLSIHQVTHGKTSVYYKKHVTSFTELSKEERDSLMSSVLRVGEILEQALKPDHMNYSLLGNYYPHVHWHLIPRYFDKRKDHFYFKNGLEPCHMGREIYGRYTIGLRALKNLARIIKQSIKENESQDL